MEGKKKTRAVGWEKNERKKLVVTHQIFVGSGPSNQEYHLWENKELRKRRCPKEDLRRKTCKLRFFAPTQKDRHSGAKGGGVGQAGSNRGRCTASPVKTGNNGVTAQVVLVEERRRQERKLPETIRVTRGMRPASRSRRSNEGQKTVENDKGQMILKTGI